jgi:hypothetical protein
VLDPFAGAGTTLKMAMLSGRRWLGFECNPEYVALAHERLRKAEQLLGVLRSAKADRGHDRGLDPLFQSLATQWSGHGRDRGDFGDCSCTGDTRTSMGRVAKLR